MTLEDQYRRYFPVIREKCRRMVGADEAQDIAQETFMRLWKSGPIDADAREVTAWVYRVATRLSIDALRRRPRTDDDAAARALPGPTALEQATASRQQLQQLLARVPADLLELAVLTRVDGLTQPEAGEVLGVTDRTVRRQLDKLDALLGALRQEASP